MTVFYTDLYLKRSYRYLQESLRPDATLFLGDLFDGGREWGTSESSSPEQRYKKYGTGFWVKEYLRFSKIFLHPFSKHVTTSVAEPYGRRLLASLPGNHDLGFAAGIQLPVKERFEAYFGPLNRIDIIGNHSFVHLDTVSLSAMDQVDPGTGSSGSGDGSGAATASTKIWKPVEDFLAEAKDLRAKAIQHTCETRFNWKHPLPRLFAADVESPAQWEGESPSAELQPRMPVSSSQFPTIVLSHVPLFRSSSVSCGPQRERGTSIPLSKGYQYQNVLTPLISQDIVKHLTAEEITMIYSGDDHDYCEVDHSEFTGRIKEITVKSMSWAMGIRLPGVQLASLWNPVDVPKAMSGGSSLPTPRDTVQNHLCLLPDQLSIFIRYAKVLGLTLVVLLLGAVRYKPQTELEAEREKSQPLLPVSNGDSRTFRSQTSSIHSGGNEQVLSTRKTSGNRATSSSPVTPPYINHIPDNVNRQVFHEDSDDWGMPSTSTKAYTGFSSRRRRPLTRVQYLGQSIWRTAWPVMLVYWYLLWTG